MKLGYQSIKNLSVRTGIPIPQLLALARQNDPFFAGAPASQDMAEWFGRLWRTFHYDTGVHLRRVHYQIVSTGTRRADGSPYENTQTCWDYLCMAAKSARYLGLVAVDSFVDRRNPDPHVHIYPRWSAAAPSAEVQLAEWTLPAIQTDLATGVQIDIPDPDIYGYDYEAVDQPYHLEVWAEKSTMDDVLVPVCRELGANLVTSLGFQSITSVIQLLQRIAQSRKSARIFYISDYDPAGDSMPVAVARQLEYWAQDFAPDQEVKLQPLALTVSQVEEYRLPTIPVKESDKRRANFEARYGQQGAVELDALEALYPGSLGQIVRNALRDYVDQSLMERLENAGYEARAVARRQWADRVGDLRLDAGDLSDRVRAIADTYRSRLEALAAELGEELAIYHEELENLRTAVENEIDSFEADLPERPEADIQPPDEDEWLLDTNRQYMEQLEIYQTRKSGVNV